MSPNYLSYHRIYKLSSVILSQLATTALLLAS